MPCPPLFPDPNQADGHGLVATTPRLTPALLVAAYRQGIFPWTSDPVGWFSPDPRAIFAGVRVRTPSNLGRHFRRAGLGITCDTAFLATVRACQAAHRSAGEWIDDAWVPAYGALFDAGLAHSVEIWRGPRLVGGIYGVHIRGLFAGESMFHLEPNASKFALAVMAAQLRAVGVCLFDIQTLSPHTAALGATLVSRSAYLEALITALGKPIPAGRWAAAPLCLGPLARRAAPPP